jgi:uncharacterized protein involved in outer membrane biogenesis
MREVWDRRVAPDFRDFRFTWRGFGKWSAITLLALLAACIVTLYFLDWNQMRGPVARYLSHRLEREVRIAGDLDVRLFSLQPAVDVSGLHVGNPGWVGTPQAARVGRARVEVRLLPLLWGRVILPLVEIHDPDLLVVRDSTGRTNWDMGSGKAGGTFNLPPIRHFVVSNGHVVIADAVRKLRFTGTVSSSERDGGRNGAFTLTGDGTLNARKFSADIRGGPLLNLDETKPYNFGADITAGNTHATVKGAIIQPFHLDRFAASVEIAGRTLSDLYLLTGLVLPNTPPYRLNMTVHREGGVYRLNDINALLGGTDLAGNLSVDASGEIPMLRGTIASRVLNFEDLGALVGGGKSAPAPTKYLLPETVMHTERLRQTNAEVDYTARAVRSRDFPLTAFDTHVSLEGGVLNLKPLAFGFTQGKLSGALQVNARKDVPVTSLDARVTGIHAENFIKGADKPLTGTLEARAVLTGRGRSVHAAASTAQGTFTAAVPGGSVRHSLAEWTGVDVLTALSLNLTGNNSSTALRCAVAHFGAKDGVLTAQRFLIDTDPVRLEGKGTINLRDETLDLSVQGKPKQFQFVRLRAPITVKGPMGHPALGVNAGPAVAQAGIAGVLGFLFPPASILAFLDPGLADDANCRPLLTEARAKGAPVKPPEVRKAPAPRK